MLRCFVHRGKNVTEEEEQQQYSQYSIYWKMNFIVSVIHWWQRNVEWNYEYLNPPPYYVILLTTTWQDRSGSPWLIIADTVWLCTKLRFKILFVLYSFKTKLFFWLCCHGLFIVLHCLYLKSLLLVFCKYVCRQGGLHCTGSYHWDFIAWYSFSTKTTICYG